MTQSMLSDMTELNQKPVTIKQQENPQIFRN